MAHVRRRYEWLYVYGSVRPSTGASWWCLLPTVNTAAMTLALATFAHDEGLDATHRAVVLLDQAGWHIAHDLRLPEGIDLVWRPPYSPELQPAECLWPLTTEALANRHCRDLEELEEVQAQRCLTWQARPEVIRAHTNFH